MSNNAPDYISNLYIQPDYTEAQLHKKLTELAKRRNLSCLEDKDTFFIDIYYFNVGQIILYNRDGGYIRVAKSRTHLYDMIDVLTR